MKTLNTLCAILLSVSATNSFALPDVTLETAPLRTEISVSEAWQEIRGGALLIDVRSPEEYAHQHFKEAINIPHTEIAHNLSKIGEDKNREIILHCKSGYRSGLAQKKLTSLGYTHVYNAGGYEDLLAAK